MQDALEKLAREALLFARGRDNDLHTAAYEYEKRWVAESSGDSILDTPITHPRYAQSGEEVLL